MGRSTLLAQPLKLSIGVKKETDRDEPFDGLVAAPPLA
jgi:hypothetical protein